MNGKLIKRFIIVTLLALPGIYISCKKEMLPDIDLSEAGHPRILLFEGEEQHIHNLIASDETWAKMHQAILEESNKILGKSALQRTMEGSRLLKTSWELKKRMYYLSYAYRMTGDERFLNKAEEEMIAASRFTDWNPSNFMDAAEMTMGMALGYDWLYSELSGNTRDLVSDAIVSKGLNPSKNSNFNSWLYTGSNWNQVCNTGMVFGALAVQEDHPDLAKEIISRAFQTLPKPMEAYQPDGVYPEGYTYWGYGTRYNALFLSAVEKALGSDRGLSSMPGFLETGNFLKHMIGPTGECFNWSDCTSGANLKIAMFWFAQHTNDPSLLYSEKRFLTLGDYTRIKWIQTLPVLMIWARDILLSDIVEPEDKLFVGQGPNPVAMMRSNWEDSNAVYLGFKAGSPAVSHGHMDVGSFIMEAENIRWAIDLGKQDYYSLEKLGMKIFGKTQDAERWTVFRMSTYSHNVLIIDNQQQRVEGYAKIDKYSDAEDFMYAVSDISGVYTGQLQEAIRGVGILEGKYSIVRDEINTGATASEVRWNMVTGAEVELGDQQAILTNYGRTLYLKVKGPDNLVMRTWSTAPTNDYDAENPGTIMVGFECEVPANTSQAFEVILVPGSVASNADFLNLRLDEW